MTIVEEVCTITAKGQTTVPKAVRQALGVGYGVTRIHLETLTQARTRPHVLDDATIDRSKQVHTDQLEFVDIYARQISRWRTARPSADQMS